MYEGLLKALAVYNLKDVKITIDLIERRGFDYKNDIGFTLFSPHVRGELGQGGRYNLSENNGEEATGFTLYMDSVRQAVHLVHDEKRKDVKANASWEEIKELQDQGYLVSRGRT
jgi:ATP phosphoribosyltransferase regulatory subunit